MKRQSSFLWVIFVTLAAFPCCSPSYQTNQSLTTSALVRVDCQGASIQQQVLEMLRAARGKDISVVDDGACVTAAFSPMDTSPERLAQMVQKLNNLPGVTRVEVVENPHPIRQNF